MSRYTELMKEINNANNLVGFTNLFGDILRFDSIHNNSINNFPFHDIIDISNDNEERYVIKLALAGYDKDEIEVKLEKSVLTVSGKPSDTNKKKYLVKGISKRSFTKSFKLSDFTEVNDVHMGNGLLVIDLVRKKPKKDRPKYFKIT